MTRKTPRGEKENSLFLHNYVFCPQTNLHLHHIADWLAGWDELHRSHRAHAFGCDVRSNNTPHMQTERIVTIWPTLLRCSDPARPKRRSLSDGRVGTFFKGLWKWMNSCWVTPLHRIYLLSLRLCIQWCLISFCGCQSPARRFVFWWIASALTTKRIQNIHKDHNPSNAGIILEINADHKWIYHRPLVVLQGFRCDISKTDFAATKIYEKMMVTSNMCTASRINWSYIQQMFRIIELSRNAFALLLSQFEMSSG